MFDEAVIIESGFWTATPYYHCRDKANHTRFLPVTSMGDSQTC